MTLKVVHTKDGRTLYKDLDTGHWVPKDKAESILSQIKAYNHNRAVKQDEDLKAEQIRKQQEEAKRLNGQSLNVGGFEHKYTTIAADNKKPVAEWHNPKSGWTISAKQHEDFISNYSSKTVKRVTYLIRDETGKIVAKKTFDSAGFEDKLKEVVDTADTYYKRRSDPEPYKDILGPKKHIDNPAKRAEECHKEYIINSKFYDDKEEYYKYHKNCALCSTAVALQGMGYDVEAMPREKNHWRGFGHILDVDYSNTDNYIIGGSKHWSTGHPRYRSGSQEVVVRADENDLVKSFKPSKQPDFMPKGAKEAATMITEKVKSWGNGAIGEMSVSWKESSKWHSVTLLNIDGTVKLFDGQDNSITTDIEKFLKDTYASRTSIVRLDNAKLRKDCQDDMKKMVKQVDRSFAAAMKRVDILPNSLGIFKH